MDSKGNRKKSVSLAESSDQRRSRSNSMEKRGTTLRLSAGTDRPPRFTTKFKSLIDDYTKLYKEHQEIIKENSKLQNGIARYFKEHLQVAQDTKKAKVETKEEKERNAGEAEEEHQRRYESGFRVVKELTKKIAATKDDAAARNEKMKTAAAAKEVAVQSSWKAFEDKQLHSAKAAVTRDGQALDPIVISEHLEKIRGKLHDWREVGMRGALIWKKKQDLEDQLRRLGNAPLLACSAALEDRGEAGNQSTST
ncbi:uncharacterized protein LOC129590852 [Paramacrobiotus metropolitanus]|uniref:uncharacterized protein LOC129590852 n=1 Tax=Paramacrobiotus metropolitanus TaxID=2943436 RepID=UPI002445FA1B|nr:uncharacterized protein LOC129590852 [Paramacrobiotus metropolitanus]